MGLIIEPLPINWVYVTHLEWALAVESRLGFAVYRAEARYLTLLLELIENIRHMSAPENFQPLQFFQQNRAAIFQAEQVREEAFLLFPEALKQSLPGYKVTGSKAESTQGWLAIYRRGSNLFKYIIGYYELFHEARKVPTYRIQLIRAVAADEAKEIQEQLLAEQLSNNQYFEIDNTQPHHVLSKTYELQPDSSKPLHEIIIASLQNDWQPLEKHWLS